MVNPNGDSCLFQIVPETLNDRLIHTRIANPMCKFIQATS
jgi:hypothetical protein